MSSTIPFFLVVVCLSLAGSFASKPTVLLSSNVTSLEVGQSAKLTCQLVNYEPAKEWYDVNFYTDSWWFCEYAIKAPDSTGHRSTAFYNDTHYQSSLGFQSLSSTFPVYEITLTPTVASTTKYWCDLYAPKIDVHSNYLFLTVTPPPPPSSHLTSTVSFPLLAQPFTLTCTFANFTAPPPNYSVQFSSSPEGQLAVFEVSNGNVLLSDIVHSKVQVLPGPKSTFPTFHLILTEKVEVTSAYWCALVEDGKAPVQSNTWPLSVHLISSKLAVNQRLGTCTVGGTGSDLSGKTYSVQFMSDLGPEAVNLLGEYIFRPNLFEEFKSNPLPPWTSIRHGPSTTWPEFILLATGTGSLNGTWWCVLAVGVQGAPDYREITSEKVHL